VFGRIGSLLVSPVSLFHQTRVLSALLSQTTPQEAASFIGSRWVGDPSREKTHFLSKLKPIFDESIVSLSLLRAKSSSKKSSRMRHVMVRLTWKALHQNSGIKVGRGKNIPERAFQSLQASCRDMDASLASMLGTNKFSYRRW